jgi:sulfur carrier protein
VEGAPLTVVVNGQAAVFEHALSVAELLDARGLAGKRVAVERNGEIVPRSRHAATWLEADDRLEIVVAVGGG